MSRFSPPSRERKQAVKRNDGIDCLRGILIILVVAGHYAWPSPAVHHVIFLFHMPMFLMLSGWLLDRDKCMTWAWLGRRAALLLVPYAVYLTMDMVLVRRTVGREMLLRCLWGGRALGGIYWYVTCFLVALLILRFWWRFFSDRTVCLLALLAGAAAVMESHWIAQTGRMAFPGVPGNADVALLAVVYLVVGFYGRERLRRWLEEENRRLDWAAVGTAVALTVFCWWNVSRETPFYSFDMKQVIYPELGLALLLPCAFFLVFLRLIHWGSRRKGLRPLKRFLAFCGRNSLPIMFLHVPLNMLLSRWLSYGGALYLLIGVGAPLIVSQTLGRWRPARFLLGLPKQEGKTD